MLGNELKRRGLKIKKHDNIALLQPDALAVFRPWGITGS